MVTRTATSKPLDFTKLEPRPKCFPTDEDWYRYCELAQDSTTRGVKLTRERAARMACDDCSVFLQGIATMKNLCFPPEGAITPFMRMNAGIEEEDEPWPELELPE